MLIAAGPLHAQTLLWEIRNPENSQPSYIFGILHDVGLVQQLPDYQLAEHIQDTEVLAVEHVSDWPGENLIDHALFEDNQRLYDVLRNGQYRRACRFFWHFGGLETDVLDDYQPAYLAVLAAQYQRREGIYLDWVLRDMAAMHGKPVLGLESMNEQMAVLQGLETKEQAALLDAMVRPRNRPVINQQAIAEAYLNARLDSLSVMLSAIEHPAYLPAVVSGRNRLLSERIESLTSRYTAFIAVGAAHLAGEDNLLDRLSALGMQVIPIQPSKPVIPAAEQVPEAEALDSGPLE